MTGGGGSKRMSEKLLHICTLTNDLGQYAEMRRSMESAGFTEEVCRYTLLDNSQGNRYDPFAAVTSECQSSTEPYLIFCHQDIRLDRGHGMDQLLSALRQLDERDPKWAVAGNAGVTAMGVWVGRITDPRGVHRNAELPCRVISLDENFLVVRTASRLCCSPDIGGFHLYATDLCLNAVVRGFTAHVVDFHLRHLSAGDANSPAFRRGMKRFARSWNGRMVLASIESPTRSVIRLSRFEFARRLLKQWKFIRLTRELGYTVVPSACPVSATPGRGSATMRLAAHLRDTSQLARILLRVAMVRYGPLQAAWWASAMASLFGPVRKK